MSAQVFMLPDLGEGLTEATILEWRVAVGDIVEIDQVVVEVETAKASVEVPIPFAGRVSELHGSPGEVLDVETPLITVTTLGDENGQQESGSGNVLVGYGTSESASPRRRQSSGKRASGKATATDGHVAPAKPDPVIHEKDRLPARVISPVVRTLARQHGIDLEMVGSGISSDVITRADVERAITRTPERSTHTDSLADKVIPISGFRKTVADKLSTSRREIPDATTWVDIDATELLVARKAINDAMNGDAAVSLMALVARLAIAALHSFPELNATVASERNEITQHGAIHLGVAAQTPRGLIVPVIRNAGSMSTVELSDALRTTVELARSGKISPDRLAGGTFTLNNYGVFGVDGSTPIINHPEAAILGIGRIIDRPWIINGELQIRKIAQSSLSFDHRVCDGGAAGGFLRLFADYLQSPVAALGKI